MRAALALLLVSALARAPGPRVARRQPTCRPPLVAMTEKQERGQDAGRMQMPTGEEGMKNINRASPSEARIAELRSKVEKLKGMNAAILEGEALLNPKRPKPPLAQTVTPPARLEPSSAPTASPPSQTTAPRAADASTGVSATLPTPQAKESSANVPSAAATAPAVASAAGSQLTAPRVAVPVVAPVVAPGSAPGQTSSSIGGTWQKPPVIETYKPSGSGSWGIFERPTDISKAMGGGKQIGVNAPAESAEERAAKDRETEELLRAYLAATAAGDEFERQNGEAIAQALAEAKQLMRVGEVRKCVRTLEPFWRNCSVRSELGGRVGLELALAYDAACETDKAAELYEELLSSSSVQIRKLAKQLKFGLEAMELLGFEAQADMTDITAYAAMSEIDISNRYEQSYGGVWADLPIQSVEEALAVLQLAASDKALRRWEDERVRRALAVLRERPNWSAQRGAPLTGVWRLVLWVGRRGGVGADERLRQIISPAAQEGELRVSRLSGAGLFVAELEGAMRELPRPPDAARAAAAQPVEEVRRERAEEGRGGREGGGESVVELPPYELAFESYRLGPLRLPGGAPVRSTVIALDETLLVQMEQDQGADISAPATFLVWAQA